MKSLKVLGFYDEWNPDAKQKIHCLFRNLSPKYPSLHFEIINIHKNMELWKKSQLKTIPAVIIYDCNEDICFFAGKICDEKISSFINHYLEKSRTFFSEINYVIIDSSSCHRYERWNEQFLLDGIGNTGWSSASSPYQRDEYLILDLLKTQQSLNELVFFQRLQQYNDDLKKSFPSNVKIYLSNDNLSWNYFGSYSLKCDESGKASVGLNGEKGRYIKLVFSNDSIRLEGKFFIQLSRLKVYASFDEANQICSPVFGSVDGSYYNDFINKKGIFHGDNVTTEILYYSENQKSPERVFYDARILLIVLKGTIRIKFDDLIYVLDQTKWLLIPAEIKHQIINNDTKSTLLEIKDNVPSCSVWGNR